ncbi:hypothetical protein [Fusobacterium nucleatum]|jgi:phage protein|uniref:hypothetical protein n=1 Tax=Fusobacterium nucleatum TaxID=851 RepID=UPI0030CE196D
MSNTLSDLNTKLFEQLENLTKKDMSKEDTDREIIRTEAIVKVAGVIISNGELALKAAKFRDERLDIDRNLPKMLEG